MELSEEAKECLGTCIESVERLVSASTVFLNQLSAWESVEDTQEESSLLRAIEKERKYLEKQYNAVDMNFTCLHGYISFCIRRNNGG